MLSALGQTIWQGKLLKMPLNPHKSGHLEIARNIEKKMMISRSCCSKYNHKYDFQNRLNAIIKIKTVQHCWWHCDEDEVDFNDLSIICYSDLWLILAAVEHFGPFDLQCEAILFYSSHSPEYLLSLSHLDGQCIGASRGGVTEGSPIFEQSLQLNVLGSGNL